MKEGVFVEKEMYAETIDTAARIEPIVDVGKVFITKQVKTEIENRIRIKDFGISFSEKFQKELPKLYGNKELYEITFIDTVMFKSFIETKKGHSFQLYEKIIRNNLNKNNGLEEYSILFKNILKDVEEKDVFNYVAKLVEQNDEIAIEGKAGVGKTTFMIILYHYLYFEFKEQIIYPFYINLHDYDFLNANTNEIDEKIEIILKDIAMVQNRGKKTVVLIDGLDNYCQNKKKIMEKIDENYLTKRVKSVDEKSKKYDAANANVIIYLSRIKTKNENELKAVIKSFVSVNGGNEKKVNEIFQKVIKFGLEYIDLKVLAMLFENNGAIFKEAKSFEEFLEIYCNERARIGKTNIASAAEISYKHFVLKEEVDIVNKKIEWLIAHEHHKISTFLNAFCFYNELKENREIKNFLVSNQVNKYIKYFMNKDKIENKKIIFGNIALKMDSSEIDNKAKASMAYILGRYKDRDTKEQSKELFHKILKTKEDYLCKIVDSNELLFLRSIFISLIKMGDNSVNNKYIHLLLTEEKWRDINNGFHLEYYEDIEFQDIHKDDFNNEAENTYEILVDKIENSIDNHTSKDELLDIDIITLASLTQNRLINNTLKEERKGLIIKLLKRVQENAEISGILQKETINYIRMNYNHLSKEEFSYGEIVRDFFNIKSTKRQGWLDRNYDDQVDRIESVADHTVGSFVLCLLFLKKSNEYDKEKILKMLTIHDIHEAFTGDITPKSDTYEEKREIETDQVEIISFLSTYSKIDCLEDYKNLWNEFECGKTKEARIAKDLDRLESLIQLYLYRKEVKDNKSIELIDFENFRGALIRTIKEVEVKDILTTIMKSFEKNN